MVQGHMVNLYKYYLCFAPESVYLTLPCSSYSITYIDRNNVIPSRNGKCTLTNRPWQNQIHMNDDIIMMTRLAPS